MRLIIIMVSWLKLLTAALTIRSSSTCLFRNVIIYVSKQIFCKKLLVSNGKLSYALCFEFLHEWRSIMSYFRSVVVAIYSVWFSNKLANCNKSHYGYWASFVLFVSPKAIETLEKYCNEIYFLQQNITHAILETNIVSSLEIVNVQDCMVYASL